ncbi:MAG: hypothetical protein MJE68_30840 [Proteobacteria bacterium]|nr:hypothetical protein [Pseudomonadota bacterium]
MDQWQSKSGWGKRVTTLCELLPTTVIPMICSIARIREVRDHLSIRDALVITILNKKEISKCMIIIKEVNGNKINKGILLNAAGNHKLKLCKMKI